MKPVSKRLASVALVLTICFFLQETWALAGVTGNLTGSVRDAAGAPVAGAAVTITSPSQTAKTATDAQGHFVFLSLLPDTYTVSVEKAGFQPLSAPGTVVFADQTQTLSFRLEKSLRTIANVSAAASGSLVKAGVGGDLYSVNSNTAAAAAPLGGGSNLNSAYSAISTVPGVQVTIGGAGWTYNGAYVRGQNQSYTGYEFDGIPVNRAFDNYNASTESNLGLQELQVYTGGGPASVSSSGISGFINQVFKTGTYPGYAQATVGIGADTYYHQASVEIGGSTPDRNFSYYAGFSGYNQGFRLLNGQNGANFMQPNGIYSGPTLGMGIGYSDCVTATCQGVKTSCAIGQASTSAPQGCWEYYNGLTGFTSQITDRENVINLHFGIPKRNGLRDDVQALWSASALNTWSYSSIADVGTTPNQFFTALFGAPYAAPSCGRQTIVAWAGVTGNACGFSSKGAYLPYADNVVYNLPFGTPVATAPGQFVAPTVYSAPDTPTHAFHGPIPLYDESVNPYQNDTNVAKLQYTYALSHAAYLRAYAYTFYSDWLQTSPLAGSTQQAVLTIGSPQYDLITHTAGGALNFADQIGDQHLLTANYDYTTATSTRFNNSNALPSCGSSAGCSPIGYMQNGGCYDAHSGAGVPCIASSYFDVASGSFVNPRAVYTGGSGSCDTGSNPAPCGWLSNAAHGPTEFGRPGAAWQTLWNGEVTGSYNTVRPRFQSASIADQWRPNDRFVINASMRYDDFTYVLPQAAGPADAFYANMIANYTCVQPSTNTVLLQPLPPGAPPPANPQYVSGDCNAAATALAPTGPHTGWVHPNGTTQNGVAAPHFTANSPGSYSVDYWQPRFSMTYTQSPDTVWRLSAGRYVAAPLSSSVQYLSASGDNRTLWGTFMGLGFYSPFHPIPGVSSSQYDLSFEHRLHGTDMSLKISPFYTWVNQWQQQSLIGAGFVTTIPVGVNRDYGVEMQFSKGDFAHNGLSGLLSFTYTDSKIRFQNVGLSSGGVVPNETVAINQAIAQYNQLTRAGGGAPCYRAGTPVACNAKPVVIGGQTYDTISNPYYNQPAQGALDPNGWYAPFFTALAPNVNGALTSYISPIVASAILNYRRDRLAVTPSLQFQNGGYYGSPLDVNGYDPRACQLNSGHTGITGVSPLQCNTLSVFAPGLGPLGYFYIPNPQTGRFSALGSYQNPSILTGNLQVTYDLNSHVRLSAIGTNLFHTCFGGTPEPWTAAYQPGPNVCGYLPAGGVLNSTLYPGNFYNGKGINDFKNNGGVVTPWTQSYLPSTLNNSGLSTSLQPFNVYFSATVKL